MNEIIRLLNRASDEIYKIGTEKQEFSPLVDLHSALRLLVTKVQDIEWQIQHEREERSKENSKVVANFAGFLPVVEGGL